MIETEKKYKYKICLLWAKISAHNAFWAEECFAEENFKQMDQNFNPRGNNLHRLDPCKLLQYYQTTSVLRLQHLKRVLVTSVLPWKHSFIMSVGVLPLELWACLPSFSDWDSFIYILDVKFGWVDDVIRTLICIFHPLFLNLNISGTIKDIWKR